MTTISDESQMGPSQVAEDDSLRSTYMQRLIFGRSYHFVEGRPAGAPRIIVQFWDDMHAIPADVQRCLDSWAGLQESGFALVMFDDESARHFISEQYDERHAAAFDRCMHPAMRSDYFRLCFIAARGGMYVDADDEYLGHDIEHLFRDDLLKVQPLCYDVPTDSMLDPFEAANSGNKGRTFYVNNNPLVAPANHPVIVAAVGRATDALLRAPRDDRDVQSLTGPGNLTAVLVAHAVERDQAGQPPDFELLPSWDSIAVSKWPLEYRSDHRNWRNWVRGDG